MHADGSKDHFATAAAHLRFNHDTNAPAAPPSRQRPPTWRRAKARRGSWRARCRRSCRRSSTRSLACWNRLHQGELEEGVMDRIMPHLQAKLRGQHSGRSAAAAARGRAPAAVLLAAAAARAAQQLPVLGQGGAAEFDARQGGQAPQGGGQHRPSCTASPPGACEMCIRRSNDSKLSGTAHSREGSGRRRTRGFGGVQRVSAALRSHNERGGTRECREMAPGPPRGVFSVQWSMQCMGLPTAPSAAGMHPGRLITRSQSLDWRQQRQAAPQRAAAFSRHLLPSSWRPGAFAARSDNSAQHKQATCRPRNARPPERPFPVQPSAVL